MRQEKARGIAQTGFYAIVYDIADDKRRTKVHKILKGFGKWTQFSLFEGFLTKKELLTMRSKLDKHLSNERDRVRIYHLCENCLSKIETVGLAEPAEDTYYLV